MTSEEAPDEFALPVRDVRAGDRLNGRLVIGSRDGRFGDLNLWTIDVMLDEDHWPWVLYPVYGYATDDDGNKYVPEDGRESITYSTTTTVKVTVDGPQVLHPDTLLPIRWWVAVYELDRVFGGIEEGGWWFDTGTLVRSVPCKSFEEAQLVQNRLVPDWPNNGSSSSVAYQGGDYGVWIEKDQPGDHFPEHHPHYC